VRHDADGACVERAARFALHLAERLGPGSLPRGAFLNVNLPPEPTRRVKRTRQGNPLGPGDVRVDRDPRGKPCYWIGNRPEEREPPGDTDRGALAAGLISVTLVSLERTHPGPFALPDLGGGDFPVEVA